MQRTVFITGGSRGIGLAISKRYHTEGYTVLAPPRNELDLGSISSIFNYLEQRKPSAGVLINNAAQNKISSIQNLAYQDWEQMLQINLTAPFLLMQYFLPIMAKAGWGRVVNIGSAYSIISKPGRVAYSASKSGLNGLTRTAALEYAQQNILINSLCPGFVETDLTRQNNDPEQLEALRQQIPMKRLASPDEIADFVYFLGSERNTYITGQAIAIDGGFLAQ